MAGLPATSRLLTPDFAYTIVELRTTELFAGHNWKQLGAILIILLLLLVIGIAMWWILDNESKSQLTLILNSEYTSVYTCTQFLFICVYAIYICYVTRSDIDLVEYPNFIDTCYSCVFPVLLQVSN